MIKHRRLNTFGCIFILIGLLTSPAKEFAVRCWSNPAGWLEAQCQQFKDMHWPWGFAILAIGVLLVVASFVAPRHIREDND